MTQHVQVGDLRVALRQEGRGPALLLMHGAEASMQMFAALVPLLVPHFTVICYDQRDCGETEGPESASTLGELADDAHGLIGALGLHRTHVFGSSFGGRVAQALALRHPESVDRLVLGSTWPLPATYEEVCPDAERLGALRRALPASAETLAGWFFPETFLLQRPDLRGIFSAARPETPSSARRMATVNTSLPQSAADIAAPTLLIAGELDRVVPATVTLAMADQMPHAEAVQIPGVGHVTAIQAPEALARELIRFFGASDAAGTRRRTSRADGCLDPTRVPE